MEKTDPIKQHTYDPKKDILEYPGLMEMI